MKEGFISFTRNARICNVTIRLKRGFISFTRNARICNVLIRMKGGFISFTRNARICNVTIRLKGGFIRFIKERHYKRITEVKFLISEQEMREENDRTRLIKKPLDSRVKERDFIL